MNKTFYWGNETWHVPSAYLFKDGVVIDFFAEINTESFIKFRKDAEQLLQHGRMTLEDEERFLRLNPSSVNFFPSIIVNGIELSNKSGHGDTWYPESCRDEGAEEDVQSKYLVEHYGFDLSRIWVIRRCTFSSKTNFNEITSLRLKMVRSLENFSGIHFIDPCVGDTFKFTHPVYGTEHTLTVMEYEAEEMEQSKFDDTEWIFPTHLTAMRYTVSPNLPREEVSVRDCASGDSLRRKASSPNQNGEFSSAIGVIGSSNGATAVMAGASQSADVYSACSSLHFEKQDSIEWRMNFRVKMVEDMAVELI